MRDQIDFTEKYAIFGVILKYVSMFCLSMPITKQCYIIQYLSKSEIIVNRQQPQNAKVSTKEEVENVP